MQTVTLKSVKKNQPTTVEITKSDVTTGVELDGAKLTVLDKEGNVVDQLDFCKRSATCDQTSDSW